METATQILEMTAQLLRPEESVTIGVLPPEGGMTLQVAGGAADARYLDGSSRRHLTLQLLCKDTQKRSFDRLAVVCPQAGGAAGVSAGGQRANPTV